MSMKRLLFIQHEAEDPPGSVADVVGHYAVPYDVVQVEHEPLPAPDHYAAIIALGGAQHVYEEEKYPYLTAEKDLLRTCVARDIPYLGICLGGQLLASALGGLVKKHTTTEIGFYDIPLTQAGLADPLYKGFPGYHKVFHWHEDTFDLPSNSTLIASNAHTTNQAFRYGRRAYGLQYHIEVTLEIINLWSRNTELQLEESEFARADSIEQGSQKHFPTYQEHTRLMTENFLRISALI
jgi:GMP synthase (glutamine-hydrolysing)